MNARHVTRTERAPPRPPEITHTVYTTVGWPPPLPPPHARAARSDVTLTSEVITAVVSVGEVLQFLRLAAFAIILLIKQTALFPTEPPREETTSTDTDEQIYTGQTTLGARHIGWSTGDEPSGWYNFPRTLGVCVGTDLEHAVLAGEAGRQLKPDPHLTVGGSDRNLGPPRARLR